MKLLGLLVAGSCLIAAAPTCAQDQTYNTPLYTTPPPTVLDMNYGLPTFGMPGLQMRQPQNAAQEAEPAEKSDLFQDTADATLHPTGKTGSGLETPLYTTTEGLSTEDAKTDQFTTGGFATDTDTTTGRAVR